MLVRVLRVRHQLGDVHDRVVCAEYWPVDYQNYTTEAEEYADLVADNRIAELAETDNKLLADIFAEIDTGEIPMELTGLSRAGSA